MEKAGKYWEQKIRNEEVLRRVKENRCLITIIYRRQKNWIEHILGGDGLLRDVSDERKNDGRG